MIATAGSVAQMMMMKMMKIGEAFRVAREHGAHAELEDTAW